LYTQCCDDLTCEVHISDEVVQTCEADLAESAAPVAGGVPAAAAGAGAGAGVGEGGQKRDFLEIATAVKSEPAGGEPAAHAAVGRDPQRCCAAEGESCLYTQCCDDLTCEVHISDEVVQTCEADLAESAAPVAGGVPAAAAGAGAGAGVGEGGQKRDSPEIATAVKSED